jgi:hypothetical protein
MSSVGRVVGCRRWGEWPDVVAGSIGALGRAGGSRHRRTTDRRHRHAYVSVLRTAFPVTVVLCGVAGDSTNVDPVPAADDRGRFEYVPIPEKCETSETATYGSIPTRYGPDGEVLADRLDRIRSRDGGWTDDPDAIRSHPVHHDPSFERSTYGEHRPGYVNRLRDLGPGDAVAFYAGLRRPDRSYLDRHLLGWFPVETVDVVEPAASDDATRAILDDHPHNAHAKRYRARGRLHYDEKPVALVRGREGRGGLLDRAIRLATWRDGWFYCLPAVRERLFPGASEPVGLGSRKPARSSPLDADAFAAFVDRRLDDP